MPTTIPHRELRNNSSDILRRVERGESFEITNHCRVVAEMRPPARAALSGIDYRPAVVRGGFGDLEPQRAEQSSQQILDYLRGDR